MNEWTFLLVIGKNSKHSSVSKTVVQCNDGTVKKFSSTIGDIQVEEEKKKVFFFVCEFISYMFKSDMKTAFLKFENEQKRVEKPFVDCFDMVDDHCIFILFYFIFWTFFLSISIYYLRPENLTLPKTFH